MPKLNDLLALAKAAAPLIPGGGAMVAVGSAVIDAIDEFTADAPNDADLAELQAEREQLEASVHAHARRTADSLKG